MDETILIPKEGFRGFELFCLKYDIAIDEEDYGFRQKGCIGNWPLEERLKEGEDLCGLIYNFSFLDDALLQLDDKIELNFALNSSNLYRKLIIAKRARAVLQKHNSTKALDSLDYLAEYLIRHLPEIPEVPLDCADIELLDSEMILLRIIYLNEIAACYNDFISIGYADQCLELIKTAYKHYSQKHDGKEVTPYELIAIYNKGQGYYHSNDREKAKSEFEKIGNVHNNQDYFKDNILLGQFARADIDVFQKVACIPAKKMIVESLIKLQRSQEALDQIESLMNNGCNEYLTDYKLLQLGILKLRCKIDQAEITSESTELLHSRLKEQYIDKNNIYNQRSSLFIEYNLLFIEEEIKWPSEETTQTDGISKLAKDIFDTYDKIADLFEKAKNNKNDLTSVVLQWVKGFIVIKKILETKIPSFESQSAYDQQALCSILYYLEIWDESRPLHSEARNIVTDQGYRTNKDEITKGYLSFFGFINTEFNKTIWDETISEIVSQQFINLEKLAVDELLNKSINLPNYMKNRYEWRKAVLSGNGILDREDKVNIRGFIANALYARSDQNEQVDCIGHVSCIYDDDIGQKYTCFKCNHEQLKKCFGDSSECYLSENGCEHYYDLITRRNSESLMQKLNCSNYAVNVSTVRNSFYLMVLQRWNSYTPALAISEGGGYFLFKADKDGNVEFGIAIDPGYDFLRNFFSEGFSINDIDAILVSHDHPDHHDNVPAIITLKHETMNNRFDANKRDNSRITAILSEGSYESLKENIKKNKHIFKDTHILKGCGDKRVKLFDGIIEIKGMTAYHLDLSKKDGIGFYITVNQNSAPIKIGFTCDTQIRNDIIDAYKDCDVICCHLGSLIDGKSKLFDLFDDIKADRLVYEKSHLYLPGIIKLVHKLAAPQKLIIVSEFGEELRGCLRKSFVKKLSAYCSNEIEKKPVIASDTGLLVDLSTRKIKCSCCNYFDEFNFIDFEFYGPGERLFVVCKNCMKTLTRNQRELSFKKIVTSGRSRDSEVII
jgi:hypothetical protein